MTVGLVHWKGIVAAATLAAASVGAHAALTLVGPQDFNGTGLGAVNTILTLASPGNSTFEAGSVGFGNVITGDAMTGGSQTQTRTLGELGVASAESLRVVFNALEPGNGASSITLGDLVLNIYSPTGTLLFTSGTFTPVTFADTQSGAGNSGFVFGLDAAQQAAAATAFGADFQSNVVALTAAAGCTEGSPAGCQGATGGFETFFVANAAAVTPIPEPATAALMLAGLAVVAYLGRRRVAR
jgi:hypothetical protein